MSEIPRTPRIESTLLDLIRAVDDGSTSTAETASVVRHVLESRRARFAAVPLVAALTRRTETTRQKQGRR